MPASSNVCRQFQQGNRVACVAPGKFDPLAIGQARWDFLTSPIGGCEIARVSPWLSSEPSLVAPRGALEMRPFPVTRSTLVHR